MKRYQPTGLEALVYSEYDVPYGRGTMILSNGNVYEGFFIDGNPVGQGRLLLGPQAVLLEGTFNNLYEPIEVSIDFGKHGAFKGRILDTHMEGALELQA